MKLKQNPKKSLDIEKWHMFSVSDGKWSGIKSKRTGLAVEKTE